MRIAPDLAAWQRVRASLSDATLLVDAILGTGLSQPLQGFLLEVVRDLNSAFPGARVVAVDLPSGISADNCELIGESVRADATVTFAAERRRSRSKFESPSIAIGPRLQSRSFERSTSMVER